MPEETNVTNSDYAIFTKGLVRDFGQVRAVDGIDLAVHRGEVYGFLGPNGAGKTTVIRMLITLLAPTSGEIKVAGYDVVRQPNEVRLRVGAAQQEAALDNKQTGRELLRLQGKLYGLSHRQLNRRIEELSGLVDIGGGYGPDDRHLFGRYETPPGLGRGLDPQSASPLFGRTHHRLGPY